MSYYLFLHCQKLILIGNHHNCLFMIFLVSHFLFYRYLLSYLFINYYKLDICYYSIMCQYSLYILNQSSFTNFLQNLFVNLYSLQFCNPYNCYIFVRPTIWIWSVLVLYSSAMISLFLVVDGVLLTSPILPETYVNWKSSPLLTALFGCNNTCNLV